MRRLKYGDYSAYIRCGEEELQLYDTHVEDGNKLSCWIASEEGKEFSVHWRDDTAQTCMDVFIYMDGRLVHRRAHRATHEVSCEGARIGLGERQTFVFSPVVLTDDDSLATSGATEDLGTIQVTMTRTQGFARMKRPAELINVKEIGPVHERSKKAGAHAVSLGRVEEVPVRNGWYPIGKESEPFVTFIFRYRPLALLQAMDIAPRPHASPQPSQGKKRAADLDGILEETGASESKRRREDSPATVKPESAECDEVDDDDADDITFLREQMAMMQQRLERAEAAKRAKRAVKRELSPIRVPPSSSREVIDLT
ncbi:hypothetical protein OH77DRAFT_1451971 [Trametes cingulata]|nr:hypothetical protein OH77DRAFT_1451971 [Trametes cingulata]